MDINELIAIVKKKLTDQIRIDSMNIEDKSFLHKNLIQKKLYHQILRELYWRLPLKVLLKMILRVFLVIENLKA